MISVQSCTSQHENHIWLGCTRLCSKEYFPQIFGPEPNTHSDAVSRWVGWALAHPELRSSINPIPTRAAGGQIMPTKLLLAHPDLKT